MIFCCLCVDLTDDPKAVNTAAEMDATMQTMQTMPTNTVVVPRRRLYPGGPSCCEVTWPPLSTCISRRSPMTAGTHVKHRALHNMCTCFFYSKILYYFIIIRFYVCYPSVCHTSSDATPPLAPPPPTSPPPSYHAQRLDTRGGETGDERKREEEKKRRRASQR